jgi:hypothetical protein
MEGASEPAVGASPEDGKEQSLSPLRDSTGIPKEGAKDTKDKAKEKEKEKGGHKRTASADLKFVASRLKPSLKKNLSDAPISKELSERARSAPLVKKFNLPPTEPLINDFSAALLKHILIHGRLYVSQNYICFESKIFGIKTMEVIPFKDVSVLTKKSKKLNITRGIEISTSSQTYYFASFVSRVRAFALLTKIWREHVPKTDQQPDEDDDDDDDEEDYESDDSALKKKDKKHLMKENTDANLHKLAHSIEVDHVNDKASRRFSSPLLNRVLPTGKSSSSTPNISASTNALEPTLDLRDSAVIPNVTISASSPSIPPPAVHNLTASDASSAPPSEDEEEDDTNYDSGDGFLGNEATYQPVLTTTFNCTVKGFYRVFFADESNFTNTYRENRGDKDIVVGKWTTRPQFGNVRDVQFLSPVKVPLGPSHTRATEIQRYHLSKNRLLIDTVTNFLDIPYGDSFRIEGKWDVVPVTPETCKLVVSIGVHFMKKTWFKSKIESTTIKETKESFQQWANLATTEVAKAHKSGALAASALIPSQPPSAASSPLINRPSDSTNSLPEHPNSSLLRSTPTSSASTSTPHPSPPLSPPLDPSSPPPTATSPPTRRRRGEQGGEGKGGGADGGRFEFIGRAVASLADIPLSRPAILEGQSLPQVIMALFLGFIFLHMYLRIVHLEGKVEVLESILQPLFAKKL